MHRPIGRARRKALEALVQLARAEHDQHHELVEVGAAARDADLLAHDRMAAVAADDVIGLQHLALGAASLAMVTRAPLRVLLDLVCAVQPNALSTFGSVRHPRAQHLFHLVLRQPVVLLEVVVVDELAPRRRVPVLAHQIAVAR